jgi:hypothetical protein
MSTATTTGNVGGLVQPLYVGRVGSPWDGTDRPLGLIDDNQLGMKVDQFLGLQLVAPITEKAQLNLAYLWLDSNEVGSLSTGVDYNRLSVYGGDLKVNLDPITLDGGYSATILQYNEHKVVDEENAAWWVNAGYKAEKWGIKGGYKEVQTNFAAPGDWGRIGMWWNPVDLKGYNAAANLTINDKATLKATGEWYTGINDSWSAWGSDQKVDRYTAELGYKLNTAWDLNLGWEYVQYNLASGTPKPEEIWYNVGLNYGFNDKAKLSVLWQISDYNSKGVDPFTIGSNEKYTGGLITTQLSIKF